MEIRIAIADANASPTASFPVTELPTNPTVSQLLRVRYKSGMLRALLALLLLAGPKPAELNLRDVSGNKVQLRDYRRKKVVLNFWATWCVPCREEMPMLLEIAKTWSPRGVTFIAVSLDDEKTKKDIQSFITKYGVTFPVWIGGSADTLDKLHMGEGVPDTAFIDSTGVIRFRVLGEIRREELEERLAALTSGAGNPAELVNHMK
jgi:cytochrome c biogenesis protein CcmG/thiol:disulfide interchange protein DsbE